MKRENYTLTTVAYAVMAFVAIAMIFVGILTLSGQLAYVYILSLCIAMIFIGILILSGRIR